MCEKLCRRKRLECVGEVYIGIVRTHEVELISECERRNLHVRDVRTQYEEHAGLHTDRQVNT